MAKKLSKKNSKLNNNYIHDSIDNGEIYDLNELNEIDENEISYIKQKEKSILNSSNALNESRIKIAQKS